MAAGIKYEFINVVGSYSYLPRVLLYAARKPLTELPIYNIYIILLSMILA